ncbi:MAG: ZIP family metal transporter [Candidatus Peribacteraceae bacterium]|nr:ZIP family metal transporter [Candidatus Peribacteraceae bacterium]
MPPSPALLSLAGVLVVSAISLIGIFTFALQERLVRACLLPLIGFSTGALLGDVFLHMLPEMAEKPQFGGQLLLVLGGILLSFVIEKFIHWRHCHCSALPHGDEDEHLHPVGIMNLIGDGIHNFIDGALIAGSFLVAPSIGIATTVAVILHEIPQEIGDFAILLFSGFSRSKALFFNALSGGVALLGAVAVLLSTRVVPLAGTLLLPIAAGNFLYLAGSDLIPELHKEARLPHALLQLFTICAGIAVMASLKLVNV